MVQILASREIRGSQMSLMSQLCLPRVGPFFQHQWSEPRHWVSVMQRPLRHPHVTREPSFLGTSRETLWGAASSVSQDHCPYDIGIVAVMPLTCQYVDRKKTPQVRNTQKSSTGRHQSLDSKNADLFEPRNCSSRPGRNACRPDMPSDPRYMRSVRLNVGAEG
jgi:hypothetical protein